MLKIDGLNIKSLPFENLSLLQTIEDFEGVSILEHYIDERKDDIISYLVDFDKTDKRILYAKITKNELLSYLIGINSLKQLLESISSDYLFLVDYNRDNEFKTATLISKYRIPTKYFPSDDSFYEEDLNDFYSEYLKEQYYYYRLKENAFIVTVKPKNDIHGQTVGAREAAIVLNNTTNSVEGYIRAKSFNVLKNDFGNADKINRRITTTKNFLSPRIAQVAFGSFEVWLAIDTLQFHGQDKYDSVIREGLIDGYKKDVLDVDFTSEEDAKIITEKFSEDERKMIFEPIWKLVESDRFYISISDPKKTIKRNTEGVKSSNTFWKKLLPPPTEEELQKEEERKNKIVSIIISLKDGENVSQLTKKELRDNLLFTEEIAETIYEIKSPIIVEDHIISLKKSIPCTLTIDENNHLQLFNDKFGIHSEGEDFKIVVSDIKNQVYQLISQLKELEKIDYPKYQEIKSYLE